MPFRAAAPPLTRLDGVSNVIVRQGLLWLSERRGVFNFVRRNGLARRFASRFVAGETIEQAVDAAKGLTQRGITASLDLLGESVTAEAEAAAARDQYLRMLDSMAASGVEVNVSVKLTQMGLDIDEELCAANMTTILEKARALRGFVRLDMEGSAYTQRTLDFFARRLFPAYGGHCGVVIQAMLRRSERDVENLIAMNARVRLCKGAYLEAPTVAFPEKADVDRNYVSLMERLLQRGDYPGLATHDEAIIGHARQFVRRQGIPNERFEFQMLYGVRRDLQERLRRAGHNLRVYIPFGTQWYPYLMRRLAERPANIAFLLGNVVRESVPGR
jgi:proline dehydrogenase